MCEKYRTLSVGAGGKERLGRWKAWQFADSWIPPKSLPFPCLENKKRKRQTTRIGSHQFRLFAVFPLNAAPSRAIPVSRITQRGVLPSGALWIGAHNRKLWVGKKRSYRAYSIVPWSRSASTFLTTRQGGDLFGRPKSFFWKKLMTLLR